MRINFIKFITVGLLSISVYGFGNIVIWQDTTNYPYDYRQPSPAFPDDFWARPPYYYPGRPYYSRPMYRRPPPMYRPYSPYKQPLLPLYRPYPTFKQPVVPAEKENIQSTGVQSSGGARVYQAPGRGNVQVPEQTQTPSESPMLPSSDSLEHSPTFKKQID